MTTQKKQDLSFEFELMNAESSDEEYINPNIEKIFNKPNPINEQKSQSEVQNPMPVINKSKQLTSEQKLKMALDRKKSKRQPKKNNFKDGKNFKLQHIGYISESIMVLECPRHTRSFAVGIVIKY